MSHDEKIKYLRIASNIAGFAMRLQDLDLLVSLYELVLEKKEIGTIKDVSKIEAQVKNRADIKAKSDLQRSILLDKVSDKL